MTHLSIDEILAYVAGSMSEEDAFGCERHFAECEECGRRVHAYYGLRESFDELWDSWTAKTHAREALLSHIRDSLAQAEAGPGLRERLSGWAMNLTRSTLAAFDVVIDSSRRSARVITEGLESLTRSGEKVELVPIPQPVRLGGPAATTAVSVQMRLPSWVRVDIDPTAGRISVRGRHEGELLPIAVLVPIGQGKPLIEEFHRIEEAEIVLSEFEGVRDGEYILLLESIEHAG